MEKQNKTRGWVEGNKVFRLRWVFWHFLLKTLSL